MVPDHVSQCVVPPCALLYQLVPSGLDAEVARDSGCDGLTAVLTPTVGVAASSDPGEV